MSVMSLWDSQSREDAADDDGKNRNYSDSIMWAGGGRVLDEI